MLSGPKGTMRASCQPVPAFQSIRNMWSVKTLPNPSARSSAGFAAGVFVGVTLMFINVSSLQQSTVL